MIEIEIWKIVVVPIICFVVGFFIGSIREIFNEIKWLRSLKDKES